MTNRSRNIWALAWGAVITLVIVIATLDKYAKESDGYLLFGALLAWLLASFIALYVLHHSSSRK